ncbi:hypothetical protein ANO14919_100910 [Xylariales sp. No.14919]|nr:hypothetical protein ANO14919_100910 [Xylariales sp. No.14919]
MTGILHLLEAEPVLPSRIPPRPPIQEFRERLADNETFKNDFIGASVEECGAWTHEQQAKIRCWIRIMVILDARRVEGESITLWFYPRDINAPYLRGNQKVDIWYPFRIPYSKVVEIASELTLRDADESWGVYFHRKAELTDHNGIFDVDRARELVIQGEGFVLVEEEQCRRRVSREDHVVAMVDTGNIPKYQSGDFGRLRIAVYPSAT